jgi:hypothetical protein
MREEDLTPESVIYENKQGLLTVQPMTSMES